MVRLPASKLAASRAPTVTEGLADVVDAAEHADECHGCEAPLRFCWCDIADDDWAYGYFDLLAVAPPLKMRMLFAASPSMR